MILFSHTYINLQRHHAVVATKVYNLSDISVFSRLLLRKRYVLSVKVKGVSQLFKPFFPSTIKLKTTCSSPHIDSKIQTRGKSKAAICYPFIKIRILHQARTHRAAFLCSWQTCLRTSLYTCADLWEVKEIPGRSWFELQEKCQDYSLTD